MHNLVYLTTYCTQNEHNSSITFEVMACARKYVTDGPTDRQTRPKTIVAIQPLRAEVTKNTYSCKSPPHTHGCMDQNDFICLSNYPKLSFHASIICFCLFLYADWQAALPANVGYQSRCCYLHPAV